MTRILALLSFAALVTAAPALSATIEARSGADVTSNFVIAGFGPLPLGLDAQTSAPTLDIDTYSSLAAPDAVPDSSTNTVINGVAAATPSIFFESSSNLRNGNTEGSATNVNHTLYQVLEIDGDADGTNDVSERGVSGAGFAQSRITTDVYKTGAESSVNNARTITFINNRAAEFTFGIQGLVEMVLFAEATGEEAEAQSSATLDFFFQTTGLLDIVYAAAGPFTDTQILSGPNAFTDVDLETGIASTGHFTLSGTASALGSSPGVTEFGTIIARQDFVFGITLQPGQQLSMTHGVTYAQATKITPVPLPAGLPLLICGISLLGLMRSGSRRPVQGTPA